MRVSQANKMLKTQCSTTCVAVFRWFSLVLSLSLALSPSLALALSPSLVLFPGASCWLEVKTRMTYATVSSFLRIVIFEA